MASGPDIDARFEKALRAFLRRRDETAEGCPDPAILAAYFEQTLGEDEVRELDRHLASCVDCQAELALLARMDGDVTAPPLDGTVVDTSPAVEPERRDEEMHRRRDAADTRDSRDVSKDAEPIALPAAVELRAEQLEPSDEESPGDAHIESAASEDMSSESAAAEHDVPTEEREIAADDAPERQPSQPFVHIPRRSRWRWVAPTALAATAVIAVSVTYRFAFDEAAHRGSERSASQVSEPKAMQSLDERRPAEADIDEEHPTRMEAAPPPPVDSFAKKQADPGVPAVAEPPPVAVTGGSAPPPPQAAHDESGRFADKAASDLARANSAPPSAADIARNAPSGAGGSIREKTDAADALTAAPAVPAPPAASAARAPASLAASSAPLATFVVASRTNRLLEWRFTGPAIERSDDGGRTWQPQGSPASSPLLAASAPTAYVCWAVGKAGVVMRTLDGRSWQLVTSPTAADLVQTNAWNESSATVKSSEGLRFSTTDGGATWSRR